MHEPTYGAVRDMVPITPSDTVDNVPAGTRILFIEQQGNVSFIGRAGVTRTVTFGAGWHMLIPTRIRATGTTALGIYAGI